MGDELGGATDIASPCVFRAVYTTFHLDEGTTIVGAVLQILRQNVLQKMVILSFLGYLGEIESDSQSVWTCICTTVSQ